MRAVITLIMCVASFSALSVVPHRRLVIRRSAEEDRESLLRSAEVYRLRAEKLRLEAARDELLLQKEKEAEMHLVEEGIKKPPKETTPGKMLLLSERSEKAASTISEFLPKAPATFTREKAQAIEAMVRENPLFYRRSVEWCSNGVLMLGNVRGSEEDLVARLNDNSSEYRFFLVAEILESQIFDDVAIDNFAVSELEGVGVADAVDAYLKRIQETALIAVDKSITTNWVPVNAPARVACVALSLVCVVLYCAGSGLLLNQNLNVADVLVVASGLSAVELSHEIAHVLEARRIDVDWSFPGVPLPSLYTGLLSTVNRLQTHAKTRRDLFDLAVSGPVAGFGISAILLLIGAALDGSLSVPSDLVRHSCLASLLAMPFEDVAPDKLLSVHPLFVAGLAGLASNALQLLPFGRTDGGRAYSAAASHFVASGTVGLIEIFTALFAFVTNNNLLLLHVFYVFTLQADAEEPCQNEFTPIGQPRAHLYKLLLVLAMLALLPLPHFSPQQIPISTADSLFPALDQQLPGGFPTI